MSSKGDMIRVVHSIDMWLGGTETWLYNQIKYLGEEIEPHILCQRTENLDRFGVANIHQLVTPSRLRWHCDRILRRLGFHANVYGRSILRELMKIGPSIFHSHFGHSGWLEMPVVRKAGLKHVVSFYGYDVSGLPSAKPVWTERYKRLFEHVDRVLCEGPFMAKSIVNLGCADEKIRVHHLGIPLEEIPFRPRMWEKGRILRVLIAGTFREKKGIPYAIEALRELHCLAPFQVTIIGDAHPEVRSQVEKRRILEAIERCGLEKEVRMLGYRPYAVLLNEAYAHDIFISPSVTAGDGDSEGGAPVALIEMAATGMPIVSTKHCDIPEVIRDGYAGLLAEERDVGGLADRLRWLVEHPEEWSRLAENARKHIEAEYDAVRQGACLARIYRELVLE